MRNHVLRAAVSLAAIPAISAIAATPAIACQGPQFERSLVFLSETKFDKVPEGMTQYRVLISEHALRNVYDRDLLKAHVRNIETGDRLSSAEGARTLAIVIPVWSSCDQAMIPGAGQYFVLGRIARGEDGGPVTINGADVFYPHFKSYKKPMPLHIEGQSKGAANKK